MKLSEKILQSRKALGLSQEQLAEQMGVSRQSVSKWETGQSDPDLDKVISLSRLFGISTDELLGNTPEEPDVTRSRPMENYIQANLLRRFFTLGWVTTLVGTVALATEWISLYFIRNATIALEIRRGAGYYTDVMQYAKMPPMCYVILVTLILILMGLSLTVFSLWKTYRKQ